MFYPVSYMNTGGHGQASNTLLNPDVYAIQAHSHSLIPLLGKVSRSLVASIIFMSHRIYKMW